MHHMHSFNKYLLSTYYWYMPGFVLGASVQQKSPCSCSWSITKAHLYAKDQFYLIVIFWKAEPTYIDIILESAIVLKNAEKQGKGTWSNRDPMKKFKIYSRWPEESTDLAVSCSLPQCLSNVTAVRDRVATLALGIANSRHTIGLWI